MADAECAAVQSERPNFIAESVERALAIGSPAYPWPDGALAARARAEADPPSTARRRPPDGAIRASSDRRAKCQTSRAHRGAARRGRPLVPVEGGRDTPPIFPARSCA